MGRIPRRVGYDSALPASWADGSTDWHGWLTPDEYPSVVDPESGLIWTANNRIVDGDALTHLGANGYWLGARGQQIRDALAAEERPGIEDMLAIQLDNRALLQQEWRDVLLKALADGAAVSYPWRDELRDLLERWNGRAEIDSVGYRIAREFRRQVVDVVLSGLLAGCSDFTAPAGLAPTNQVEGPIWQLITEQPEHLLPPPHASWNGLLLSAADTAVATCGPEPLSGCTWGNANQVDLRHPLADVLGILRPWLRSAFPLVWGLGDRAYIGPHIRARARLVGGVLPSRLNPGDLCGPRIQYRLNGASHGFRPGRRATKQGLLSLRRPERARRVARFFRRTRALGAGRTRCRSRPASTT